jgi:hypothetical protein
MNADDYTLLAETADALPEGWVISVDHEGAGCVELVGPGYGERVWSLSQMTLADALFAAVRVAMGRGEA